MRVKILTRSVFERVAYKIAENAFQLNRMELAREYKLEFTKNTSQLNAKQIYIHTYIPMPPYLHLYIKVYAVGEKNKK